MILNIILSIIVGAVVIMAAEAAIMLFGRGDKIQAIAAGLIIGLINFYSPVVAKGATWIAPLFLAAMLCVSAVLLVWWHKEGSDFVEMIPILVLTVLVFFTSKAAASATTVLIGSKFFRSIVMTLPLLLLVGSIGFYLIDLFQFRMEYGRGKERRYE